jgi:peptidoglycan hydrolase-like protein with peptidoglycan-binding domain
MQTLEVGSTGVDVELWQSFLNRIGYSVGAVDGIFGVETQGSTEAFQKANNLTPDGIVGNLTLAVAIGRGFKLITSRGTPPPRAESFVIAEIAGVQVSELASGIAVFYRAGMDVDADGSPHAYNPENTGLDVNEDAMDGSEWVGIATHDDGSPVIQNSSDPAPGFYVSTTSFEDPKEAATNPSRYVDAAKIPYIVIPGGALGRARLGHPTIVLDVVTGRRVKGIVADAGPRDKIGEASMFLAAAIVDQRVSPLGDPDSSNFSNPRTGGTDAKRFLYIILTANPPLTLPLTLGQIDAAVDSALSKFSVNEFLTLAIAQCPGAFEDQLLA